MTFSEWLELFASVSRLALAIMLLWGVFAFRQIARSIDQSNKLLAEAMGKQS